MPDLGPYVRPSGAPLPAFGRLPPIRRRFGGGWGKALTLNRIQTLSHPSSVGSAMKLRVRRLDHARDLPLPRYETAQAAGLDLVAAVTETVALAPGARAAIPCGIAIALPDGYEAQVRPRSGLAAKHGVTVLNAPGTIDADYRGEIAAILINHGPETFYVTRGLRVAQMVVAPVVQVQLEEVADLGNTARGTGGFGSTGR